MTLALSEVYWYFAVDADHDVSGDAMQFSLDKTTWADGVPGPPSSAAQDKVLELCPVADGFTRYWWRALSGGGNDLPFIEGKQDVYGKLSDNPQTPAFKWSIYVEV